MITSRDNQRLKEIAKLQEKRRARDEAGLFVCEGRRMFEEARGYYREGMQACFVSESFYNEMTANDPSYFDGADYDIVSDNIFNGISKTVTPQGVLVVLKQKQYELEDVLGGGGVRTRLLLLEDIQDPGNLGTMLRTAEAAGMSGVVMTKGTVDIYNPKVIRSTMGSIFRVPFMYTASLSDTMCELKAKGIKIYAAGLRNAVEYKTVDYSSDNAIMIGNEGNGLSDEALSLADSVIKIPMHGQVESLNAAIAAAVLMFALN